MVFGSYVEKFWKSVNKADGCWLWTGAVNPKGYGYAQVDRTRLAHRVAYQMANGPISAAVMVCHHCDVPACVNPAHLYAGDARANARDAIERGRLATGRRNGRYTKPECTSRGEGRPAAKLTWAKVAEIRRLRHLPRKDVAAMFGVSVPVICNVLSNKAWHEEHAP